jgi:hypothetical protein
MELRQTTVLSVPLREASAKIRSGPPIDDDADYGLPVWAGVIPIRFVADDPVADLALRPHIELPHYASAYRRASQ